MDSTSPSYAGGARVSSSNSGVNWDSPDLSNDYMFEDWGDSAPTAKSYAYIIG